MDCPECGHDYSKRVKGKRRPLKPGVPRYQRTRECPKCKTRFVTAEVVIKVYRKSADVPRLFDITPYRSDASSRN